MADRHCVIGSARTLQPGSEAVEPRSDARTAARAARSGRFSGARAPTDAGCPRPCEPAPAAPCRTDLSSVPMPSTGRRRSRGRPRVRATSPGAERPPDRRPASRRPRQRDVGRARGDAALSNTGTWSVVQAQGAPPRRDALGSPAARRSSRRRQGQRPVLAADACPRSTVSRLGPAGRSGRGQVRSLECVTTSTRRSRRLPMQMPRAEKHGAQLRERAGDRAGERSRVGRSRERRLFSRRHRPKATNPAVADLHPERGRAGDSSCA